MNFKNTQAKKLSEMMEFMEFCKNSGYKITINNKGDIVGFRPGRIHGANAVYSSAHYEKRGDFIFIKGTKKAVDVVRI